MKQIILTLCAVVCTLTSFGQTPNAHGDNIVGVYMTQYNGDKGKVRVPRNADGTYNARTIWAENPYDKKGNRRKDVKNPDKALRGEYIDNILLIENLRYLPNEQKWGEAKIYDPNTGMKVNASAEFESAECLKVRGTFMGFGVTLRWVRVEE